MDESLVDMVNKRIVASFDKGLILGVIMGVFVGFGIYDHWIAQ